VTIIVDKTRNENGGIVPPWLRPLPPTPIKEDSIPNWWLDSDWDQPVEGGRSHGDDS